MKPNYSRAHDATLAKRAVEKALANGTPFNQVVELMREAVRLADLID